MFKPYENDSQSQQIGELIIENQTDKVTIYGDIDIAYTQQGLIQAKQLQQLINDIVMAIEQGNADNKLIEDTQGSQIKHENSDDNGKINNPFA